MTSHDNDALLARIEALELCVATLIVSAANNVRVWNFHLDNCQWLEERKNGGIRDIMNPQDMVKTKASGYEISYKEMEAAHKQEMEKQRLVIEQRKQREEDEARQNRERQEEAMYQKALMEERVRARVRAQAKILEEEAMRELKSENDNKP